MMKFFQKFFLIQALFIPLSVPFLRGQGFEGENTSLNYRIGFTDEASLTGLSHTPLNPDNRYVPQARQGNFSNVNIFSQWRMINFSANGFWKSNDLTKPDWDYTIKELYLDKSITDYFRFSLGRKIMKWGTGYAFNPTGVVEPRRDPADPSDRLNQYQGLKMLAVDAFYRQSSLTLVYSNDVTYNRGLKWAADEYAVRFYSLVQGADVSLVAHWKEKEKNQFGFNFAYTYGDHWEFHSEFLGQRGTDKYYHNILFQDSVPSSYQAYPYQKKYDNSGKIFYQLLLGGKYTFQNGLDLTLEYFRNEEGLTSAQWNRWYSFLLNQKAKMEQFPPDPDAVPYFFSALNTLGSRGTMQNYGFLRATYPFLYSTAEVIIFMNLDDLSGVVIPAYTVRVNNHLSLWVRYSHYLGDADSEFGILFIKSELNLGCRISF
jgi:hypothetical protein